MPGCLKLCLNICKRGVVRLVLPRQSFHKMIRYHVDKFFSQKLDSPKNKQKENNWKCQYTIKTHKFYHMIKYLFFRIAVKRTKKTKNKKFYSVASNELHDRALKMLMVNH